MTGTVTIIDYGVGNIGALVNMFDHLEIANEVATDAEHIKRAEKLVLPGVGAFDTAARELRRRDLVNVLTDAVLVRQTPVLGVCLGMQLLARSSEEGECEGLGWIAADVVRLKPADPALKVPHIGWTDVQVRRSSPLFEVDTDEQRFYFVHSYFMKCDDENDVLATVAYDDPICIAVSRGNIHGVQFHPEKSHRFGMRLLRNFANS